MTSQNHGYAVDCDTLPENASLRFVNGNDGTCEGVDYTDMARVLRPVPPGKRAAARLTPASCSTALLP